MATSKNKKLDNKINAKDNTRAQQDHALNASMLFFALGIITLLGIIHPFDIEILEQFCRLMKYLLGKCHIMLPALLFIFSGRMLLGIALGKLNASFVSFLLTLFCLPALIHHMRIPELEELYPGQLIHGGGLIGGALTIALRRSVGEMWTYVILIGGLVIAVALVMPWKQVFASRKKKETRYDKYLENSAKAPEPKPFAPKNEVKPEPKTTVSPVPKAKYPKQTMAPVAAPRQNVYGDDEFSSFTDGIKQESTFKKILNLGIKDGPYEQEDIKEEIERDPVQIPEWEEDTRREPVLRPVISYGNYAPAAMPDRRFMDPYTTVAKEPEHEDEILPKSPEETVAKEEKTPAKPYESIIYNPYHRMQQDMEVTQVEPEEKTPEEAVESASQEPVQDEAPVEEPAPEDTTEAVVEEPDETQEEKPAFVIHKRVDEAQTAALEGYVDAQEALNTAARVEAGLEAEAKPTEPPKPKYIFPTYDLLSLPQRKDSAAGEAEIMQQCGVLEQTLADFKVRANVVGATRGPAVTQFELRPAPGVKVNSVVNLADDIALNLAVTNVRIEAPIPGKSAIGIEVPNLKTDPVSFREIVDSDVVRNHKSKLGVGLGKDISGNIITADIAKMPHLLIAGSTGSGKSVCINTIICGILYKALPEEVKLILVDPKVVELSIYDGIPHLLTPVVTDPKKAASALHWAVMEMERRYALFATNHVRNIDGYNNNIAPEDKMPYIVIIIDEMADLMVTVKADIETAVMRLAAKARAAGIHMILATQRPSVDVITGVLKNNIPSRIAFAVTSLIDSRTILDAAGAEKLLGKGDMLFSPYGSPKPTRVQGSFVSDEEVGKIVDFIKEQSLPVEYSDEVTSVELESDKKTAASSEEAAETSGPTDDPLFEKALNLVLDTGQASASMMQRRFSIGYNRAARLVDTMAELGVVGKAQGSKPREVIMSRQEAEERFLNKE